MALAFRPFVLIAFAVAFAVADRLFDLLDFVDPFGPFGPVAPVFADVPGGPCFPCGPAVSTVLETQHLLEFK
jgi:hypothetical protein